jgi:hypothetical protein
MAVLTSNSVTGCNSIVTSGSKTILQSTGSILQVVQTLKTDTFTTTSTTPVAVTGFSVDITPISTTNKILVIVTMVTASGNTTSVASAPSFLYRNGSVLVSNTMDPSGNSSERIALPITRMYLDSPNSTSQQTYQVYINRGNTVSALFNRSGTDATASWSTITAMEVVA